MKTFNPMQYLAIDIANQFGLDKVTYEERIQWVKDNLDNLEQLADQAEEPMLYWKAVKALRQAQNGEATGHTVALDSVCSGLQIMSALMRDKEGCTITGLTHPDKRYDAYTEVTDTMNELIKNSEEDLGEFFVDRKQSKSAVMTYLYGSKAVPEEVFGAALLPYFYDAMNIRAKGAMELLGLLHGSWNSDALAHSWTLPDGHTAYIPVMQKVEKRIAIKELSYNPVVTMQVNESKDKGISNIANVVHSIDAYVLRTMIRRCNYSKPLVEQFMDMSKSVIYTEVNKSLKGVQAYLNTQMADISVLDTIDHKTIKHYPEAQIQALRAICEQLLQHKPFEVIVIHDSFSCSPVNCNQLRHHYKEILAELSDSTVIDDILNQLYGDEDTVTKGASISHLIRNSSYGIC